MLHWSKEHLKNDHCTAQILKLQTAHSSNTSHSYLAFHACQQPDALYWAQTHWPYKGLNVD